MIKAILSSLLLMTWNSYAQKDTAALRELEPYRYKEMNIADSIIDSLYGEDALEFFIDWRIQDSLKYAEGWYYKNKKEGWWIRYHEDGITPKLIGKYHNNRPLGAYRKLFENGILAETGYYERGRYKGELVKFYESGCLKYKAWYNDAGHEADTVRFYFDCDSLHCCDVGQIEFIYKARDGKPIGTAHRYYPSGKLMERIEYNSEGRREEVEYFEDEPD